MRHARLPRAIVLFVTAALLIPVHPDAVAAQLLANPGFDDWIAGSPADWTSFGAAPGDGAAVIAQSGTLQQRAPVVAGSSYTATVASSGSGNVRLELAWLTAGFSSVGVDAVAANAGAPLILNALAHPEAAHVTFKIIVVADGGVAVESASLAGSIPQPTSAPPSVTVATPTRTATSEPLSATPTATRTERPSPSAPPTGSPTAPGGTAAATSTPSPSEAPVPTLPPAYGGLLTNGNFERLDDGRPYAWSKFGGTMSLTSEAYGGDWALALSSDGGGTRWVHQAAAISPGEWYLASAAVRVAGSGEAWIRLSWYTSVDGSGSAAAQADGTVATGGGWTAIDTVGQAPEGARSVRVRLMLRAPGEATAYFDNAALSVTTAPPPAPATIPGGSGSPGAGDDGAAAGRAPAPYSGARTIAISELLADPAEEGRDAAFEWVELVNYGTEPVSLESWQVGDARDLDAIPPVEVAAGGYLLVAAPSAALPAGAPAVYLADGVIGAGLNNGGDAVRLIAPDGALVDAVSFGADTSIFEPAPAAPGTGETLGIRVPGSDPEPSNWAVTLAPSPGLPNAFPVAGSAGEAAEGTPARGAAVQASPQPEAAGAGGNNALPVILLAAAGGAGLTGAVSGLRRAWPSLRGRASGGR